MEEVDFDSHEEMRYKKKKRKYIDTVKTRKMAIEPLLERQSEILASNNPLAQIHHRISQATRGYLRKNLK